MGSHENGTPLHCIHIDHDWHHRHDVHLAHPHQGHLSDDIRKIDAATIAAQ